MLSTNFTAYLQPTSVNNWSNHRHHRATSITLSPPKWHPSQQWKTNTKWRKRTRKGKWKNIKNQVIKEEESPGAFTKLFKIVECTNNNVGAPSNTQKFTTRKHIHQTYPIMLPLYHVREVHPFIFIFKFFLDFLLIKFFHTPFNPSYIKMCIETSFW